MSEASSSDLLRASLYKHDISYTALVERLQREESMPAEEAKRLVKQFVDGGPCSLGVAAALITLIVDKKEAA